MNSNMQLTDENQLQLVSTPRVNKITIAEQLGQSERLHENYFSNRLSARKLNITTMNHNIVTMASSQMNSSYQNLNSKNHHVDAFELINNQQNQVVDLKKMEVNQDETFKQLKNRLWKSSFEFSIPRRHVSDIHQ